MLSSSVSIWSCGMSDLIALSTSAKMRSVCSIRVPGAARTWRRICPASTDGKKSLPIRPKATSETELATIRMKTTRTATLFPRLQARNPP